MKKLPIDSCFDCKYLRRNRKAHKDFCKLIPYIYFDAGDGIPSICNLEDDEPSSVEKVIDYIQNKIS